jgi:L-ascorbate metabolism protein UlaG (beta-lactamase superfamily)
MTGVKRRVALLVAALAALAFVRPMTAGADPVTEARTAVLGSGWNDPGQVRLRWYGVTNFVASFGGHVVLLDAWVIEGTVGNYAPLTVADLISVDPEYIYIGHGHFDHAAHAGEVAEATGAKIIGTVEHCDGAKRDATNPSAVTCVPIYDASSQPFHGGNSTAPSPPYNPPTPYGTVGTPAEGPTGLGVTAVMHKHSSPRFPDPSQPRVPVGAPNGPPAALTNPPDPTGFAHTVGSASDAEGGSVAYRFTYGDLTVLWHDTSGPVSVPGEGGATEILSTIAGLGPIDLEIGAVQGFNQISNGLKDARLYMQAAGAKVFMPAHHDNWLPPNVTTGAAYYQPLVDEMALIPAASRPNLCFITDPDNYAAAFTFTTSQWASSNAGTIAGCWTPA